MCFHSKIDEFFYLRGMTIFVSEQECKTYRIIHRFLHEFCHYPTIRIIVFRVTDIAQKIVIKIMFSSSSRLIPKNRCNEKSINVRRRW